MGSNQTKFDSQNCDVDSAQGVAVADENLGFACLQECAQVNGTVGSKETWLLPFSSSAGQGDWVVFTRSCFVGCQTK